MGYKSGIEIGKNFIIFFKTMMTFLPLVFILIGLFEVWVKQEVIERHLGDQSGILGYFWALLLAGTAVGGLYVAFPVASSLYKKGARISTIFTYIGAAAVCRVPMTLFEASYLGMKFTFIRLMVAIPLIIFSSILFEKYLKDKKFSINNED